jgi:hypothetical protein
MPKVLLKLPHHTSKLSPIDQLQWFALRESQGFICVNSASDEDGMIGSLGGHDPEQFANRLDAHSVRTPALALDDRFLAISMKYEIDAAIASTSADFLD